MKLNAAAVVTAACLAVTGVLLYAKSSLLLPPPLPPPPPPPTSSSRSWSLVSVPTYTVRHLTLPVPRNVSSVLLDATISVTMTAGLDVTNDNCVGTDVHGATFDIYYPGWDGKLTRIGVLKDWRTVASERKATHAGRERRNADDDGEEGESRAVEGSVARSGKGAATVFASAAGDGSDNLVVAASCSPKSQKSHQRADADADADDSDDAEPLFTVLPKTTSSSPPDLATISISSLPLRLAFKLLRDALAQRGRLVMPTSGVLHLRQPILSGSLGRARRTTHARQDDVHKDDDDDDKHWKKNLAKQRKGRKRQGQESRQPLLSPSIPLAVGIICDNTLDLMSFPWTIRGSNCRIKNAALGWKLGMNQRGNRLRKKFLLSFASTATATTTFS